MTLDDPTRFQEAMNCAESIYTLMAVFLRRGPVSPSVPRIRP